MMAVIDVWHGRHTQQWLLELPLLIMSFRAMGGPQSKSQSVSVSPSLHGLLMCSATTADVVADCAVLGMPTSMSEVPHASRLSGKSCTDTVDSVWELRDVDLTTNNASSIQHEAIVTGAFKTLCQHVNATSLVKCCESWQDLRHKHDK